MLSPVKTLAGVAIAAIIATSFLVARPFETGPGSAPLGAELDPSQAAVITGTIADLGSPSNTSGTREVTDGIVRTKGIHYMNVWETSDPRLSGTATYDAAWIAFPAEDLQVEAARHVLENADGRWVGSGSTLANSGVIDENTDIAILRGEGAYEGLTAYVQMDWTSLPATIEAAIFPGEMPVVEPLID